MINDRLITITVGANRRATQWRQQTMLISELYEKLRLPARSTETMAQYLALSKGQQDDLKDVGGFVAGHPERPPPQGQRGHWAGCADSGSGQHPDRGYRGRVRQGGGAGVWILYLLHP